MKSIPAYSISSIKASNSETKEFDFFRLEEFTRDIDHLTKPHRHQFYSIIVVSDGEGYHEIDFHRYRLSSRRAFLIAPGQVHAWNKIKHLSGFVLMFTDSFVALSKGRKLVSNWPLFRQGQPCELDLNNREFDTWSDTLLYIERELTEPDDFSRDAIFYAVGRLLVYASRLYKVDRLEAGTNSTILRFRELIERDFGAFKTPADYAAKLSVTANYLNAACKKHMGRSAGTLIRDRIILEAKRLLAHTDLPVSQVAYQLKFEDNSYFGRFFKRYCGITPADFRKSQRLAE